MDRKWLACPRKHVLRQLEQSQPDLRVAQVRDRQPVRLPFVRSTVVLVLDRTLRDLDRASDRIKVVRDGATSSAITRPLDWLIS